MKGKYNMTEEELRRLEKIVSSFDTIDMQDIEKLKNLKYERITVEKLSRLAFLAKQNNKRALAILIKYYYPFILTNALNYYVEGLELEDIIMASVEGFIDGINNFQNGNIAQWTYFYIRKSISKEIGLEITTTKIGDNFDYIVFSYLKYLEDLKMGRIEELNVYELASKLGVDAKGMQRVIAFTNKENIDCLNIKREDIKVGDDCYYDKEDMIKIIEAYLSFNYQNVFKMHYGLDGVRPLTEREIAKITNLSCTRIAGILKRSLEIINNTTAKNKFKEYFYSDYIEQHYHLSKQSLRELKTPIKRLIYGKKDKGSI